MKILKIGRKFFLIVIITINLVKHFNQMNYVKLESERERWNSKNRDIYIFLFFTFPSEKNRVVIFLSRVKLYSRCTAQHVSIILPSLPFFFSSSVFTLAITGLFSASSLILHPFPFSSRAVSCFQPPVRTV